MRLAPSFARQAQLIAAVVLVAPAASAAWTTPNLQLPTTKGINIGPMSLRAAALEVGSWQLAVGSWQLAVGPWKLAVGPWKLSVDRWHVSPFNSPLPNTSSQGAATNSQRSPLAPRETLQQIATLLERGDLAAAGTLLAPALKSYPSDPLLRNLAGVVMAQQGAFEAAEAHFTTAIRLAPRAPAAYENLGRLYQERAASDREMRRRAIDVYRRLLEIDPASAEAAYQGAFLLALDGQYRSSRAMLARLPDDLGGRPQALALLVVDLIGTGETEAAAARARELAAHPDLSDADVLAVLPALPEGRGDEPMLTLLEALDRRGAASPPALAALGGIHSRAGRFAEARRALERAAAGGVTVPLLMELARTAVKMSDPHGALEYLARARAMDPANASVHFSFGMVCVELDLVREAYDSLRKAVELEPANPLINYAMGAVATHRHEPAESLPYFRKYVELKPDDPRGHFALGVAYFYSNQFEAARPRLERAARSPETATGAHLFLGRIARQDNDLETARREVERALQLNAGIADAWAELGLIQTRTGDYADARKSLEKAFALEPDHYAASVNLATLYARTRDPRRDEQAARVKALIEKREARAQEFLRIIKVVP